MKQMLHPMLGNLPGVAFVELCHCTSRVRCGSCASSRTPYAEYRHSVEVLQRNNTTSIN